MAECFICKNTMTQKDVFDVSLTYNCPFCGEYWIDENLHDDILNNKTITYKENGRLQKIMTVDFFLKAPSIAAERKLKGMDKYQLVDDGDLDGGQNDTGDFAPIDIGAFYKEYPQDAIDMFNRILANLGRLITHPSNKVEIDPNENGFISYFYSFDFESFWEMCNKLKELGWIETNSSAGSNIAVGITPKGWLTLRELKPSQDSDRAFLAMWFSEETKPLRNAVREAVTQAGYICDVVDEIHHNDYIMDKVLNLIKDSRFVIADFTFAKEGDIGTNGKILGGVRGGVYYEAGFAKGLGRPVIVSCRKDNDSEARIHFDIAQLSTIFWKQDGDKLTTNGLDFVEFMKERIIATVGKGKYYNNNKEVALC